MTPGDDLLRRRARGASGRSRTVPGRCSTRRRDLFALLAVVSLAGAIFASCSAALGSSHSAGDGGGTHPKRPTTTTLPAAFSVGIHTFDWVESGPGVTHIGIDGQALPGRVLTTEVRYPTLEGTPGKESVDAKPATDGSPYPVIVFAHGYDTVPADYSTLLDSWVRAGFVVVSPIFPDENSQAVAAAAGAEALEGDIVNEPGDIVYVLKQLGDIAADPWGQHLGGLLDLSDVGLAGQSDGANVVAMLSYARSYRKTFDELTVVPKAVVVLSGYSWGGTTFPAEADWPALLQVQSDADGCVQPDWATDLFASLQAGSEPKWFITLFGAEHLQPFVSSNAYESVVSRATTTFFELELHWRAGSLSQASVPEAGNVSGLSQTTTSVDANTVPTVPAKGNCGIPY